MRTASFFCVSTRTLDDAFAGAIGRSVNHPRHCDEPQPDVRHRNARRVEISAKYVIVSIQRESGKKDRGIHSEHTNSTESNVKIAWLIQRYTWMGMHNKKQPRRQSQCSKRIPLHDECVQVWYKEYEPIRDEQYPLYDFVGPLPTQFRPPARTQIEREQCNDKLVRFQRKIEEKKR